MPQRNNNQEPPKVMTWGKALPVLALSLVFDAARLLFEMFWFFGPAIAALYCTTKVGDVVGTVVGGALCSIGAGTAGFLAAGPIAAFGVITAIAVGLFGWMTIGLILIMTNARLFKDHAGHSLWFVGSLLVSEVPFIGALPAITVSVARMYSAQIKSDKKALAAYEKAHAAEQLQQRQQEAAEITRARNAEAAQMQQEAATGEEAAQEAEQTQQERLKEEVANEERNETTQTRAVPQLATVPNYTGVTQKNTLPKLNSKQDHPQEEKQKLTHSRQITENKETGTADWSELPVDHEFDKEGYYRVVNEDGYRDYMKQRVLRASPTGSPSSGVEKGVDIGHRKTPFPSFSKGKPHPDYIKPGINNYIFESGVPMYKHGDANPKSGKRIASRHWAYRPIDQTSGKVIAEMTPDMVRNIYKVDTGGKLYSKK